MRASATNVHRSPPRHTTSVHYLRNGGDVITPQRQLGHNTLEMVKRYLELSRADDYEAHRTASSVEKWHL